MKRIKQNRRPLGISLNANLEKRIREVSKAENIPVSRLIEYQFTQQPVDQIRLVLQNIAGLIFNWLQFQLLRSGVRELIASDESSEAVPEVLPFDIRREILQGRIEIVATAQGEEVGRYSFDDRLNVDGMLEACIIDTVAKFFRETPGLILKEKKELNYNFHSLEKIKEAS